MSTKSSSNFRLASRAHRASSCVKRKQDMSSKSRPVGRPNAAAVDAPP